MDALNVKLINYIFKDEDIIQYYQVVQDKQNRETIQRKLMHKHVMFILEAYSQSFDMLDIISCSVLNMLLQFQ